jgi:hypothetical protein
MLQVQIFSLITNLLLVLLESICWTIHCMHHSWSTGNIGLFWPQIFVHHYKENHTWIHYIHTWIHYIYTWIHYIHWYEQFSTNLQGVHATHESSTTSTIAHAALQTLGILYGPLYSSKFKYVFLPIHVF